MCVFIKSYHFTFKLAHGSLNVSRGKARYRGVIVRQTWLNTRTGGEAKNAHPSGFSRIAEKRRRIAPLFFSVPVKN